MSQHSKILEKYEKMFEDGSAYKPIRIQQPMPSMAEVQGANVKQETPLGNPVENNANVNEDQNPELIYDAEMQAKLDKIRNPELYANTNMHHNTPNATVQNESYKKLEARIELLEKALGLVMEQQTKMLKESK